MTATIEVDHTTAVDDQGGSPVHPETLAVDRCECFVCDSVIPPLSIKVTPLDGTGVSGIARARRVDLLCQHCDAAFEVTQKRADGQWKNVGVVRADPFGRERIARAIAGQVGVHYVEAHDASDEPGGDVDPAEAGRQELIARLDKTIARHEELAADARQRRAELMGVTPAEAAALGVGRGGGSAFPFTGGDMRHVAVAGGDDGGGPSPGHDDAWAQI